MLKLPELKVRCGIAKDDKEDDRLLELLERDAVAHFERATNLYFGPTQEGRVDLLSGGRRGATQLRLSAPVVELVSVESLGSVFVGGSDWSTPWALSDFTVVDGNVLLLRNGYPFPTGRRNVRVTYTGGWAAGEEPQDVRAAIGGIVAATYRDARSSPTPVEAPQPGSAALVVPGSVQDVIARWYRSPGL